MSRYIEFTTSDHNRHTRFSQGNPVHNGRLPTRFLGLRGVRVDSAAIDFVDPTIPEQLLRTLVNGRQLARRDIAYNCVTFAALMYGIRLNDGTQNPFINSDLDTIAQESQRDFSVPLNLGHDISSELFDLFRSRHTIVPAYQPTEATYLHKLGDAGPVCLSGLRQAMNIYQCAVAHPAIPEA